MEKTEQTIVVKRVKKVAGGAHGGSWKIAFADFALALMSFFLVLWLIESTTNLEKMAIAGYFSDPTNLGAVGDGGTPYVLDLEGRPLNVTNQGMNLSLVRQDENPLVESPPELENPEFVELARLRQIETLENLRGQVEAEINLNQQFEWFKDSVSFEVSEDGLMVQIIDRENRPLFDSGDARLRPYALEILWSIGEIFGTVPNKISVFGHTDSAPFGTSDTYSNWELSSDRANSARRALVDGGVARAAGTDNRHGGLGADGRQQSTESCQPADRHHGAECGRREQSGCAIRGRFVGGHPSTGVDPGPGTAGDLLVSRRILGDLRA